MSKDKQSKKVQRRQYIAIVCPILIGAICGELIGKNLGSLFKEGESTGTYLFLYAFLIVAVYIAIFLQIIVHEAGHLVFGLLTGYRYSSFRIGSFMWIKQNGKLHFRRMSLAGTGGQCLMIPPDMVDGKIPFVLYQLGGSLGNMIVGIIFLGFSLIYKDIPFASNMLMIIAIMGVALALMNGVPMRLGMIDNDGYNALSLGKNSDALCSYWIQMKVNEQMAQGVRLKDMPEEWFYVPVPDQMKNSMIAVMGVFACNRLIDAGAFEEADQLIEKLLEMDTAIMGIHHKLLICDRIYCELISKNRQDRLEEMLDKKQKKFMKTMQQFPSILRTQYTYALLSEKNVEKAKKIKKQFEKCARTYPYPSDIESEQELIDIADQILLDREHSL